MLNWNTEQEERVRREEMVRRVAERRLEAYCKSLQPRPLRITSFARDAVSRWLSTLGRRRQAQPILADRARQAQ